MAQSVTNEALWVKLSEMDKKLDKLSKEQKTPIPTEEPTGNKSDFQKEKDEIIAAIQKQTHRLGL